MGHHTTFQADIQKSTEQSQLLVMAFNQLNYDKYNLQLIAQLKQIKRHDGSEIIITDTKTGKSVSVDPRSRQSMKHHEIDGHMIYCRNSKMLKQERIDWASKRIIWLAVIENGIPISYNVVPAKQLIKTGQINFNVLKSNPTALKISIKGYMPTIPWNGGNEGFGLVKNVDVVKAFMEVINGH